MPPDWLALTVLSAVPPATPELHLVWEAPPCDAPYADDQCSTIE